MAANSVNSNNSIPQSGVSSVPQSVTSINSLGNVQILNQSQVLSAADLQSGKIQVLKRKATDSGGPMVAKVFIQKGSSGQPQAIPASQVQQSQQIIMTSMPTALVNSSHSLVTQAQTVVTQGIQGFSAHQGPVTPTKTITLSQSGIISMPGTPTKQIIPLSGGKIPISPMKSPTKIMIPVPLSKTPQKIAPAPNQVIHMVKNDTLTTVTTGTSNASKPATYTMSPSKVIIHKQPGNTGGKTSLISPMNNNVVTSSTVTKQLFLPISSGATNVQPMQVAGSKFPYVRLVTAPTSHASGAVTRTATATPQQAKPIAPAQSSGSSGGQFRSVSVNQGQQVLPKLSGAQAQRVLLPATSQVQIRPTVNSGTQSGNSGSLAQFPPGTTIISSGQNLQGVQGFAIVPAQYVEQLQQTMGGQQVLQQPPPKQNEASFLPGPASTHIASSNKQASSTSEGNSQRQRKPCNCTKSQCLKLYCDCFANGEFCSNCNCQNCFNNLEHEDERSRAIKACLDRNPMAFHPKIGKGRNGEDRRHNKGCNCKRSGCLKNYCECYEAKILCSNMCKCVGCKNFQESPERKTLMHLADAAEVRVQQQAAAKTKLSSQIQDLPPRPPQHASGERLPYTFVTTEVAEATCSCLLAQAEENERTRQMDIVQERRILEECGRCLMQIIESANRTKV